MVATLAHWVVVFTSLAGALSAAPPRKTRDRESVRNVAIIGMSIFYFLFENFSVV